MNAAHEKTKISALEYAQKLSTLWNSTHGDEWNSRAGGYVRASVWNKKQGEVRVYFGDGYFFMKAANSEIVGGLQGFKYGVADLVKFLIAQLSQDFVCDRVYQAPTLTVWFNEDGQEVESINPDAVYSKEV